MSIQVNLDQKLNAEDRAYLLSRGRRHLVLQNDRRFANAAPSSAPQKTAPDPEQVEWEKQVNELTVPELQNELSNRGLATTGKQETLRKRLIEAGPEKA